MRLNDDESLWLVHAENIFAKIFPIYGSISNVFPYGYSDRILLGV